MSTRKVPSSDEIPPLRMEEEHRHLTQRILQLTLEIVYLMTGENYVAFKLCNSLVAPSLKETHCAITEAAPPSLIPERRINKKVQDVTKEIIELLMGEEPCDRYKADMIEAETSLKPPDGSRKRNPPERCPLPLYSWDSAQEERSTQWQFQHTETITEVCANIEDKRANLQMKEESSPQISRDGSRVRNTRKRCSSPLHSWDYGQEEHSTPQDYQEEDLNVVEIKVEKHEADVRGEEPCEEDEISPQISTVSGASFKNQNIFRAVEEDRPVKSEMKETLYVRGDERRAEEEISPEISTDVHHWKADVPFFISPDGKIEEEINGETSLNQDFHPVPYYEAPLSDSARHDGQYRQNNMEDNIFISGGGQIEGESATIYFSEETSVISDLQPVPHSSDLSRNGDSFSDHSNHIAVHKNIRRFPGSKGGGFQKQKAKLLTHQRTHPRNMPYVCSKCGKGFSLKEDLLKHVQFHMGDRLYLCSYCRKPFLGKFCLERHELIHTGQKPYSCTVCGIRFSQKANLARHQRIHTGEKPFSCPACGKRYTRKAKMLIHWQSHK